jgi:ATP-dependent protease ClpP protease subunit
MRLLMPRVYVTFNAPIDTNTVQQLIATCAQLVNNGNDEIYLMLSTPGGNVAAGITLYNMLRALPVKLITHNVGNVDSIGNAIFLAADERYACAHATFMFHGVAMPVNANVEERQARQLVRNILELQLRIGSIIEVRTTIKPSDVRKLFREARTKDAPRALADGIIQGIQDVTIPVGAPVVSLVFPAP